MELKEIKTIVELMQQNNLALFEMEREGFKIKLEREQKLPEGAPFQGSMMPMMHPSFAQGYGNVPPAGVPAAPQAASAPAPAETGKPQTALREITSPMVGTFYHASSPENPPFVKVGQEVDESTVVCIIEAMKVMNEIKAETRGVIAEILVENGKPVQFGQPLFRLRD